MSPARTVKLLVVDDDPFFVRVLEKRFGAEGFEVLTAADGREGMKLIVAFEPDIVISDWMMPEVDGLELCQSVKTGLRESAPYFILLTAKGEIDDKLLGLETGADDFLVKPCDHGELMARVRAGLRIVTLTRQLRAAAGSRAAGGAGIHGVCRHCGKVEGADGQWRTYDEHLRAHPAAGGDGAGGCPDCGAGKDRDAAA